MARFFVGTSGWNYRNWRGSFYPADLSPRNFLKFYSENFLSAEVNYSFYQLPKVTTYEKWYAETPSDFVFALKLSRYISHIKRIREVEDPWKEFTDRARSLKEKLGPILIQFPPSYQAKDEQLERMRIFLAFASRARIRLALEFRHTSCFEPEMLALLREHDSALVIAHSSRFPVPETIATASFVYFRFHGPREWCSSAYTEQELAQWARVIRKFMEEGRDCYAYFNNDARADAAPNATLLRKLVRSLT
jgi:uncharacterized protein YecE (DUF72 family)